MKEDFTNIKVGDILVLSRWNMTEELVEVTKVTPKMFETGYLTWYKNTGVAVGYSDSLCRPPYMCQGRKMLCESNKTPL